MSNASDNSTPPAEAPSVQAEVAPTTAHLGDLVTLSIRVMHPNAYTVEPPAFQKNLGTFEVYSSTQMPTLVNGPRMTEQFQAQLQDFTTGPQLLPGIEVGYQDLQGARHVLKTPELQVTIQEIPPGPKDKGGDIRGIVGVIGPVAWSPWWWVLLAVGLVAAGSWAWKRRKIILEGPPPPPPVPADEMALKKLRDLQAGGWIAGGRLKEFYIALSDIIRGYLEDGFKIPALERTTSELSRDIRKRSLFTVDRLSELQTLLDSCDLVKFAKFRPEADEALKDHALAVQFVEQTKAALKKDGDKS